MKNTEKIIDPSGIELAPGTPEACKGEKVGCCDECNYFLKCFPEWKEFVFDNPTKGG